MTAAIANLQQFNFDYRGTTFIPTINSSSSHHSFSKVGINSQILDKKDASLKKICCSNKRLLRSRFLVTRCSGGSSSSNDTLEESSSQTKVPFGYSRKDVLLIGLGVTAFGVGLKSGLEFVGVDPLQAGNVVQLLVVLGMTVGWISSYMIRVASKDMTYAKQLRDYEGKVMEKRLEGLTEAEIQVLIEQVEEEKRVASLAANNRPNSEQVN
ncbi:hypothetical protein SOVF_151840 [Spinacia oleracea]|uniref:MAR-binding filament-like protein 1-1 n=1 Tax=Spinacia oleracea TaxID=3562 RepID=A0ABM3R9W0_SPIOL|nr:uncharacterized protein LOC110803185 [Spinacia oleracea]KNA09605.1 hypothetical protein SOVF_151840 [Spinacia oleracea]